MSQQAIAKWELGNAEPDIRMINTLAHFFGVDVNYLLGNTNNPTPHGQLPKMPTIEESILSAPDLSEESRKDLLKQVQMFKMLDDMKKRNEEVSKELKPKLT